MESEADNDRSTRSIELAFESDLSADDLVRVQEEFSMRPDAEGESGSRAREDLALSLFSQKKACSSQLLASGNGFGSF